MSKRPKRTSPFCSLSFSNKVTGHLDPVNYRNPPDPKEQIIQPPPIILPSFDDQLVQQLDW